MNREILERRLLRYMEAEDAILSGQSYSVEGLSLTRADLDTVRKVIAQLDNQLAAIKAKESGTSRSRLRYVVPVDGNYYRSRKFQ